MGVRDDEPDHEREAETVSPFRPVPPNRGRHRDPAPQVHGFRRRRTSSARHDGRPSNGRP